MHTVLLLFYDSLLQYCDAQFFATALLFYYCGVFFVSVRNCPSYGAARTTEKWRRHSLEFGLPETYKHNLVLSRILYAYFAHTMRILMGLAEGKGPPAALDLLGMLVATRGAFPALWHQQPHTPLQPSRGLAWEGTGLQQKGPFMPSRIGIVLCVMKKRARAYKTFVFIRFL